MSVPTGWRIVYRFDPISGLDAVTDVRGVCPHCGLSSTFEVKSTQSRAHIHGSPTTVYLILRCNAVDCREVVFVQSTVHNSEPYAVSDDDDPFFLYPPRAAAAAHVSIPPDIADDWVESQRCLAGGNPKAAAVMLRRVLYGVLIDKACKLRPLHGGLAELIQSQRLPAMFDQWLPAIGDDGHDGAHPDRALKVSAENVAETMEYTAELLRYLYIEPFEFQQRKARNAGEVPPS